MQIDNEASPTAKPRTRIGYRKVIGWGLLILVLLVLVGAFWNHTNAANKLERTLAELDHTDPGWRLEDLEAAREKIPEEENSAGVIISAAQNLPRSWPPKDLSVESLRLLPPNEMLSDEDSVHLSVELTRVQPALDIAGKLTDMPRGRHRLRNSRSTLLPTFPADQLQSQRIETLLILESVWWNQRGESKPALTACRAALNAARSMGDEPSQLSQFIRRSGIDQACRAVERTLGQGEPPSEEMLALQKLLEIEYAFPVLLIAARGERALGHIVFERVEHSEVSLDDFAPSPRGRLERALSPLWYMDIREDHALFLSLMSRRIQDVQRPLHQQVALDKEFVQVVGTVPKRALITQSLIPALSTAGETFRRKHAFLRCTILALAAERYRRDKNVWPDNVNQLCPQYLAAVALNPFDGEPLRYRRDEDGVLIYSVGQDSVNKDGNSDADIGFRLWDVPRRRQPPRPKLHEEN